jgi:N utilization substance protein B
MFNRRFLRAKVFQELYAYSQDEEPQYSLHEKSLLKSLSKAYELYFYLLSMPSEFRFFVGKQLENEQAKYYPRESIINPLKAIYQNKAILKLEESELLKSRVKTYHLKWLNTDDLFKSVWHELKSNPFFEKYGDAPEHTFTEDRKALSEIYQIIIGESELFNAYMEELFINWEDDQTVVTSFLLKAIDKMKENSRDEYIGIAADDAEDRQFMCDLFSQTVEKNEELTAYIASKTKNWEPDRIAVSDLLLMKLALCEILNFPYVPVKVSINEYLELAKLYSTPNSHGFINGILDKVQLDLRKNHKIEKLGRGLVE